MSAECHKCGTDHGAVGVVTVAGKQRLCPECVQREGVQSEVTPTPIPDINKLPMNAVCGGCGRPREDHYPRTDWQCPGDGLYFNTPSKLVRRIAAALGYQGLSNQMWFSDLDGLVEFAAQIKTSREMAIKARDAAINARDAVLRTIDPEETD